MRVRDQGRSLSEGRLVGGVAGLARIGGLSTVGCRVMGWESPGCMCWGIDQGNGVEVIMVERMSCCWWNLSKPSI